MESSNGSSEKRKRSTTVSKEEVISKLKDDGDFDSLRLKIIRKLKDNEELRNSIISIVRQSAALNRAGAENMKPRQLSDAIYEEVGNKMMRQISDGVWEIIRSGDGMQNEITETVESVYYKLVEPERKEEGEASTHEALLGQNLADNEGTITALAVAENANLSDIEPNEPPGFTLPNNHQNTGERKEEFQLPTPCEGPLEPSHSKDLPEGDDVDSFVPPGFSADVEHKQPSDGSDDDPDVPPGFG